MQYNRAIRSFAPHLDAAFCVHSPDFEYTAQDGTRVSNQTACTAELGFLCTEVHIPVSQHSLALLGKFALNRHFE